MLRVQYGDRVLQVESGTLVEKILPEQIGGLAVVAALIDDTAVCLTTPLLSNCTVRALTTESWEGQRVQRHSLALLALEVGFGINPELQLRVGPSVGFGQRMVVKSKTAGVDARPEPVAGERLHQFANALEQSLLAHARHGLTLKREHWLLDEARSYFAEHGFTEAVQLLQTWRSRVVPVLSYGRVYAIDMGPVVTRASALGSFYVICEADMLVLVYGKRSPSPVRATRAMPTLAFTEVGEDAPASERRGTRTFLLGQARSSGIDAHGESYEEQAWLRAMGISSIGSLNYSCIASSVPELIRVAEGFHEKRISTIADEIASRGADIDIVSIAGPSSSGKTTFIRRLCVQLKVNGITPVGLGLDDYYVDREATPRDETGDYDFEALEALNLPLLHAHLSALLDGERVKTPRYDFVKGKAEPEAGATVALGARDVLLVEGIHGLNPALLGSVAANRIYRILVCPLMQLSLDHATRVHASDVRLIRRIVRDRHARGLNAAQTITRWPKVRAGERRYIYPHQTRADAVFDSSLVYEMSVLRVYAERYLLEVPRADTAYPTALRLMQFLDRFVSIYPDHVPRTSILREFIGGSGFDG